jgi:GR25 family glycosyltransferase involved in LPS biosynthesis
MTTSISTFDKLPLRVISLHREEYDTVKNAFQSNRFTNPISRFVAVNGKERQAELREDGIVSIRALCEIEKMKTREAHSSLPSWGGVGCYLSHEALWHEAAASPHGLIIAEADASPLPDALIKATAAFNELVTRLGTPPDILHIGFSYSLESQTLQGVTTCKRVMNRIMGLMCYYISPRGASMLLKRSRPIEVQVDSYMGYCYILNLDTFKAFHMVQSVVPQKAWGTSIQTKAVEDLAGKGYENTRNPLDIVMAFLIGCLLILVIAHFRPRMVVSS